VSDDSTKDQEIAANIRQLYRKRRPSLVLDQLRYQRPFYRPCSDLVSDLAREESQHVTVH
jgi:hypothetical protein